MAEQEQLELKAGQSGNGNGRSLERRRLPVSRVRIPARGNRQKGLVAEQMALQLGTSAFSYDSSKQIDALRGAQRFKTVNTAYAACRRKAQDVSGVPLVLHKRGENKGDPVENGRLYDLVIDEPNPLMDLFELLEMTVLHLETGGDAFWFLDTLSPNLAGEPKEVWPLPPHTVAPIPSRESVIGGYMFNPGAIGRGIALPPASIVHFRYPDPIDLMRGLSPFRPMEVALRTLLALHIWNKDYFERDATPGSVVFEIPPEIELDNDEYDRMRTAIRQMWSGSANQWEPIIAEAGVKVSSFAHTHKEMGFPLLEKASIHEILKALGVPPAIAGHFEGLNLAQVDMQERSYWRWTLMPLLRRIRSRLNRTLARRMQPELQFDWDLSEVSPLQPDEDAVLNRKVKRIQCGLDTPNEVLDEEGRDQYEGGDVHYVTTNMTRVEPEPEPAADDEEQTPAEPPTEEESAAVAERFLVSVGEDLRAIEKAEARSAYDKLIVRTQLKFFTAWKRIFREVAETIEEKIRENPPPELQNGRIRVERSSRVVVIKAPEAGEGGVRVTRVQLPLPADAYLPNADELIDDIEARLTPLYEETIAKFGEQAGRRIRDDFHYDVSSPQTLVLVARAKDRLSANTIAMLDDVGPVLEAGFNEGETVSGLMRRIRTSIETYSSQATAAPGDAISGDMLPTKRENRVATRAERVARTEAAGSANAGKTEGFKQTGVKRHAWETSGLDNVRDEHREAHGQIVEVGSPFLVGGEALEYPGDPAGSGWNIINCNCSNEPVLEVAFS